MTKALTALTDTSSAADVTRDFRATTGKRRGSATREDGQWTVVDAAGHVWVLWRGDDYVADGWHRVTEDDDAFVRALRADRAA